MTLRDNSVRVLFALGCICVIGCGSCKLDEELYEVVGSGARDCGTFEIGAEQEPGYKCAVEAFREEAPFFVVFELQGDDSDVRRATVGDEGGEVFFLLYDDAPGGDDGDAVIDRWQCVNPFVDRATGNMPGLSVGTEIIECESTTPMQRVCE